MGKIIPCVTEIIGAYWGDEGKGRVAAFEAQDAKLVLRTTGGNNAGHTVYYNGEKIPLHLIPGGIIYDQATAVICQGVVVDPRVLKDEIDLLSKYINITPDKLIISDCAHLILPHHIALDKIQENLRGNNKIGTTKSGIGPCYHDMSDRVGIRMMDLFRSEESLKELINTVLQFNAPVMQLEDVSYSVEEYYDFCMTAKKNLGKFIKNAEPIIDFALKNHDKIVIEGAQADHLDILNGDYPDCTSSQCNPSGTLSGAGIGPVYVKKVIATTKAYCSRVGNGIFPTELDNEEGNIIRELGHEYGTTTGRPRRCGWLDLVALKVITRGYTDLCLNHLDTIGLIGNRLGYIKICTSYTYKGIVTFHFPTDTKISQVIPKPRYKVFNGGWEIPDNCRSFDELPEKAKEFVLFIEEYTKIPVSYIGIGPNNEDTIIR